ncbi:MAG: hypothetical protein Q9220_003557 [cf. Caloplaca sp. 1 TL-2023]
MTVGSGSASASAAALLNAIERDSGYGSMSGDSHSDSGFTRGWHPGLTADQPTPSHTPTLPGEYNPAAEHERRVLASHVHQLYYNQNRVKLGRAVTKTVDILRELQEHNSSWPAQYPNIHQQEKDPHPTGPSPRPGFHHTYSTAVAGDVHRQKDNVPLRPLGPKRAGTSLGESSTAESSAVAESKSQEPARLITPQAAHDFSVLKLDLKMQGLTAAEIAHSMEKSSIARILNQQIDSITRHLTNLRERIEDTSSKVLVTGDLNAGKSTFCNALLRRKILPEDEQPCTSVFCEVLDARENAGIEEAHAFNHKETIYNRNDESTYDVYSLYELEKVVSDSNKYTQCKVYVQDIRPIDESLLNNGVVDISIIDAPGLNSDSLKTTAVFAREEEIDVVVFVVNAANHFTLSARDFIWKAAVEKAYIFVVVNGYDNIKNKKKCQTAVLEQLAKLSPRTFKESSELVHFVSSNAIPVAPPPGPPDRDGSGGGSSGSTGPPDDTPSLPVDDEEHMGKHGEPGSPPNKGKGKDMEKRQDFEQLEGALRRFVLEKRAKSKLAPAKTYLLNTLTDLHALGTFNRDIAQSELDRALRELEELEPAFEQSKKSRSEVNDHVDKIIEDTCSDIYSHTRGTLNTTASTIAEVDLGVPYPGLFSAFQYADDIKLAMLDKIAASVTDCENHARDHTFSGMSGIKSLGILHLGDKFVDLGFKPEGMFNRRRDLLAREVDTEIELWDFFDVSALWGEKQEKLAGTSMALTVAGVLGGRMVGGVGWIDGAVGAARVMGGKNMRKLIVPGIITAAILATTYTLLSLPLTLPRRLSTRIQHHLSATDYIHSNATRISAHSRRALRYPAHNLQDGLQQSVHDLEARREQSLGVKKESEVARKYFGNLVRESGEGRRGVESVDLEGPAPGVAGGYEEGELAPARL